jgi:hypothetical protein
VEHERLGGPSPPPSAGWLPAPAFAAFSPPRNGPSFLRFGATSGSFWSTTSAKDASLLSAKGKSQLTMTMSFSSM